MLAALLMVLCGCGGVVGTAGADPVVVARLVDDRPASIQRRADSAAITARVRAALRGSAGATGTISLVTAPLSLSGSVRLGFADGRPDALELVCDLVLPGRTVPARVRAVDGKVYVGGDALLGQLGAGQAQWALVDEDSADPVAVDMFRTMAGLSNLLLGIASVPAAGQVELFDLGAQVWDGRQTHRYRAGWEDSVTVDMWLDQADLPVSIILDSQLEPGPMHANLALAGFDGDVDIAVPDPATVYDG